MQTEIAPSRAAEVTATDPTGVTVADPTEDQLTSEVSDLWRSHNQAQGFVVKSRDELKVIRTTLAERLHELKTLLSCPGRAGQWRSFLASMKIPRTTGDRLVSFHEKSINVDGSCTDGATKKLSDDGIAQVAKTTWARLGNKLGTHDAMYQFFSKLIIESGIPFDTFDDGILILLPLTALEPTVPAEAPCEDVVPTIHPESSSSPEAAGALQSGVAQ